jgi:transposase
MTRTGKPDLWAQLLQKGSIQDLVHKVVAPVNKNLQSDYPGKEDARQCILFPGNIDPYMIPDETAHSKSELHRILTGKGENDRKGILISITEERKACKINAIKNRIPEKERLPVKEVISEMACSMNKIAKRCFP